MSSINPETANRRLQAVTFISSPQDMELFGALKLHVETLRRPDENILLPALNEADAWKKLYGQYLLLKRRRETEQTDPAATQQATQNAATEREWNRFLGLREELIHYEKSHTITPAIREYVGLETDDLSDPVVRDGDIAVRFGNPKHPDWRNRSDRIETALFKLKMMSFEERAMIPNIIEMRRTAAQLRALAEKMDWFDQRLAAIESQTINPKGKH